MTDKEITLVFVSDVAESFEQLDLSRKDLEVSEQKTISSIIEGLQSLRFNVIHIQNPVELENIRENKQTIILSIWSGINNRNRRALVPSICELHDLTYIGADPYAAMVCSDKELSKNICAEFAIKAPKGLLIRREDNIPLLRHLDYPLVVKPLMEGGSIGITQSNKVSSYQEAQNKVETLLLHYQPPILAEEFISGREISYCIVGSGDIVHCEAIEITIEGEPDYFNDHLFSMEDKRHTDRQKKHKFINVTQEMPTHITQKVQRLYKALGKIDYMRIDGKMTDDFYCIELSADPGISPESLFAHSYYTIGKDYSQMLNDIISSRLSKLGADKP
ncbi:hypothetical protein [Vibrio gazogenes]|uniref:D-ala D-ala ligase C-terminus n=1 Tax=Vibrio gazogenes DSM 21264 = NBRC 103151 TaxID=1123492 RepID=A0A1M5EU44_VIBGA|nr:hypothetical protein [Vibrio gazogenes]USP14826.1 hypothetical protein MKS89_05820 [Vibrio gazogenes]SHF82532.1 D-ala D-ala ligase C-terminus [Vibrio gazogenes DSM 21264] [Vibrio gazogenes DSM 21264 = NBRC 103151]SJN55240.1 Vancomycin B-type resistance protein VanB [Vibrio gazogenes]